VRYRHRKRAGRPNWAEKMFRGHEDDAWRNGQPNLVCNHFYWIPDPEVRWPKYFWKCGGEKVRRERCGAAGGGRLVAGGAGEMDYRQVREHASLTCAIRCCTSSLFPSRRSLPLFPAAQHAEFTCSDSYYCNWTNNPQMWSVEWWNREYVRPWEQQASRNDPYYDLEVRGGGGLGGRQVGGPRGCPLPRVAASRALPPPPLGGAPAAFWWDVIHASPFSLCVSPAILRPQSHMNWAPNAWNDRKWTVAQGDGLFSHRDRGESRCGGESAPAAARLGGARRSHRASRVVPTRLRACTGCFGRNVLGGRCHRRANVTRSFHPAGNFGT
jgi:hypothetical protein